MTYPTLSTWIGSRRQAGDADGQLWLHDPNSGKPLAPSGSSSAEHVDDAVATAARAHRERVWSATDAADRAAVLDAFADQLDARAADIAWLDALNSGVPISITRLFADNNGGTARSAAARVRARGDVEALPADGRDVRLYHVPWGATALLLPWNAPSAMAVKKLSFALAAGATVVMKPSPASPWSAQLVMEAAYAAGVPDGVVNLVLGGRDVGEQLVGDPRIAAIAMTGSTPAGRLIAQQAAPRFARLRLELGSNNPAIVLGDAEINKAAGAIASGSLKMSGQWCEAPRRVIVHRSVLNPFVDALLAELASWKMGSSLDSGTELGPVAFQARRDDLAAMCAALCDGGARIHRVFDVPEEGWFVSPTVAVADQVCVDAEMFGPVLTVQPFDDVDTAVAMANAGQVGLAGYVFTENVPGGLEIGRQLVAGEVKINGTSALDMAAASAQSFFGSAGLGGHGDADVLDFYTGKQVIGTDPAGLPL